MFGGFAKNKQGVYPSVNQRTFRVKRRSKTKHVVRHHHFLRECVEDGRMRVEFVRSEYNLSDIFTKPLEAKQFKLLRAALMNLPVESLESPAR